RRDGAAVRPALGDLVLPGLVQPPRRVATLDARGLTELDPGAADTQGRAVFCFRPFAVRGRHRWQWDGRQGIGDGFGGFDRLELVSGARRNGGGEREEKK